MYNRILVVKVQISRVTDVSRANFHGPRHEKNFHVSSWIPRVLWSSGMTNMLDDSRNLVMQK